MPTKLQLKLVKGVDPVSGNTLYTSETISGKEVLPFAGDEPYMSTTNTNFQTARKLTCAVAGQDFYDSIDYQRSFFTLKAPCLVKKYSFCGSEDAIRANIASPT